MGIVRLRLSDLDHIGQVIPRAEGHTRTLIVRTTCQWCVQTLVRWATFVSFTCIFIAFISHRNIPATSEQEEILYINEVYIKGLGVHYYAADDPSLGRGARQ